MFLPDDTVIRALADTGPTRAEIRLRLELAGTAHLKLTPRSLHQLRGKSFVRWRATIEELSALAALVPDGPHLDHLVEIVAPMAGNAWREAPGFDRHLAAPWVLTALAGCIETHRARLADRVPLLEGIAAEFAEFIAHEQATTSWGDMARVAFNHTIIAYSALGAGAVALERHPDASDWLERASEAVSAFLADGVTAAGLTWEGITYCGYDFKYVGVFLSLMRARGRDAELVPPHSSIEQKLHRVPHWYAHETLPGGSWLQNFNDSFSEPERAVWGLLLMFGRYEPGICATVWDRLLGRGGLGTYGAHHLWSSLAEAMFFHPGDGTATPLSELDDVLFDPEVGYVTARDSWSTDATVLTFNSGPFLERARLHDQADNNSFAFVADGTPMVIDSGEGNDRSEGSPSSSLAHNLVRIDGRGEKPAGEGSGVSGSIIGFGATSEIVAVVGDAKPSYDQGGHNPVRHCVRTAVFVRRPFPYLLLHDDVDKDGCPHEYEFVVHVPSAEIGGAEGSATVRGVDGAMLGQIVALGPAAVRTRVEPFSARAQPFAEHSIVSFGATGVNPHFVVLVVPASVAGLPVVTAAERESALHVELRWPESIDRITFPSYRQGLEGDALLPAIERSTADFRRVIWNDPYQAPESAGPWARSFAQARRALRKLRSAAS